MPVVDLSLEGKVAVVTGGSKGIGRAIALAFAEHGADVAIAARGTEALEQTRDELAKTGRRALAVQADMGDEKQVQRIYEETVSALGGVDVLVNNAAAGSRPSLSKTTRDEFLGVMAVNVWGPFQLARLCRESMTQRGGGSIINIASNEALRPSVGIGMYAPSKAALSNLAQLLAKHWARDGIRVTTIAPGIVRTELATGLVNAIESSGVYPNLQRRIAEAEEIAGLALLLATDAGRYSTGTTYVVDGGEVIAGPGDTGR